MRLVSWPEVLPHRSMTTVDARVHREQTFRDVYRRAMWYPFAAFGGLLTLAVGMSIAADLSATREALRFFLSSGGIVLGPYAIYLLVVRFGWPPEAEREYRRAMRLAPIGAGVILGLGVVVFKLVFDNDTPLTLSELPKVVGLFAGASNALMILGYVFVGATEMMISEFKRKRFLRTGIPLEAEDV